MERTIVICGNGAGAAILLSHLVERLQGPATIHIIGSGPSLGAGVAYSTENPNHVLNVPSGRMSIDPDRPEHFRTWLKTKGVETSQWQSQFVPRALYRRYLREVAAHAVCANPDVDVRIVQGEVKSLIKQGTGWMVGYDRQKLFADLVIIATGNDLPAPFAHRYEPGVAARIIDNPWRLPPIAPDADLLIVGAGLTAVDALIGLLDRDHRGRICVASRHGLLPHVHAMPHPHLGLQPPWPRSALGLLRALRDAVGPSPAPDRWQGFVDALRPHLPDIWHGLALPEKRRILRHGATLWNIHRHRIAPAIGARLKAASDLPNKLSLEQGRLTDITQRADGKLTATLRHGRTQRQVRADYVINCTGPNSDPLKSHNGLIENVIASRQAVASPCGLGLDVDETNRVRDDNGDAHPSLFAIGALTRARWWEITAVPEIAVQSVAIAKSIADQLDLLEKSHATQETHSLERYIS